MAHTAVAPQRGTFFPRIRPEDLLAVDHPVRLWPPHDQIRLNPVVRGIVFAVLFLALTIAIAPVVGMVVGGLFSSHPRFYDIATAFAQLPVILAAVGAYAALAVIWEQRRLVELTPRRMAQGLGVGLILGAATISAAVAVLAVSHGYHVTGINHDYWMWGDLMTLGFTAAIVEEITFRGVLFRLLEEWVGTWGAIIGSAISFGLIHTGNPLGTWTGAIGIAMEAGLLLGALYALTRSLWTVMGLHFAWNMMLGPVFGLVVSGTSSRGHGWLDSTVTGPTWMTGGVFGIEASWITITLATLLGIATMVVLARSHQVVQPSWIRHRTLRQRTTDQPTDDEPHICEE
ncbi:hypothetical protein HMPREF1531_00413 [Propionibacterium sp. oral taxon 192 str. F0372]|uniref:CPBP family intramembrane glutamic endopeptidase n=1 Tax=Propionibacterium sp. oral taxon 192 TaxID=671222 RepID=UPI000352A430|nr:CPBP family intramembrane glutamic endopeptidase [Propionibacterium sp. oral taxon 192]EPH06811.1 hypothetical protein HMPREF1531_00413 [Propionibacterium sp. oral taxon 192 str. F0372]